MTVNIPFPGASAPQGWQCPVCHRVYAPHVTMCTACPPSTEQTTPRTVPAEPEDPRIAVVVEWLGEEPGVGGDR